MKFTGVLIAAAAGFLPGLLPATAAHAGATTAHATASDPAAGPATGSAFGLAVTGPIEIAPLPHVSSSGGEIGKSVLRERGNDLLSAAALDVKAASDRARSSIAKLRVPAADLDADAVSATCEGAGGTARIAQASIAGTPLDSNPAPNSTVPVRIAGVGEASVTLNRQERLPDGRLRITALAVDLPLGGKFESLRVASATCGQSRADSAAATAVAPAPVPAKGNLPTAG